VNEETMRIRILPIIVGAACISLTLKTIDVLVHQSISGAAFSGALVSSLRAETPPSDTPAPAAEKKDEKDLKNGKEKKEGEATDNATAPQPIKPESMTAVERELLQSLTKRREELREWERTISLRENVLKISEQKIGEQTQELETLRQKVEELLKEYKGKEDDKIRSLVKIYENMKPKEAAVIFDEINMDILLQIIGQMKEKNAAPILAKMNPDRARAITEELAHRKEILSKAQKGKLP